LAATAGVVLDRTFPLPWQILLGAALASSVAWLIAHFRRRTLLSLLFLWTGIAALSAAYHHIRRDVYWFDDIGFYTTPEARPVQVRGVLDEEPIVAHQSPQAELRSIPGADPTRSTLRVTQLRTKGDWLPVSGYAHLIVNGSLPNVHVGDEIEVVGRLQSPHGPANPGEFDHAAFLRDQHIRAVIEVRKTPDGVVRTAQGWHWSPAGWLAQLRSWGQRTLAGALPAEQSGVAVALLLGEGSTMTQEDWEQYKRTGVIHALAISGYHLVILASFVWFVLRFVPVGRRYAAVGVAIFLLSYALLAGGRPPALRAAVIVCAAAGGVLLRRPILTANTFALSWLVVGLINPTDWFDAGCQLSFLAVALIYWGMRRWFVPSFDSTMTLIDAGHRSNLLVRMGVVPSLDPLDVLIAQSRPAWQRALIWLARRVAYAYAVTFVIWLAAAPLVASRYHLVAPVGMLLCPPTVLLTAIALLAGILLLLFAVLCPPLAWVCAWVVRGCLAACAWLVRIGDGLPGGHWYVADIPQWWLWVFYLALLGVLLLEPLRRRWRWAMPAGAAWLCVGLLAGSARPENDELRCTFLAVGHGGCTVLELPDGRILLYDAGALGGPDVTRKQIAPFLWQRGIRRIDEIMLSHADLDHFNGLPALLERFAVGQVTCTPTFADKNTPGVRVTLAALESYRIPVRIVRAGDRLAGGEVEMEVMHPPADGPEGNENARSLVLRVRHAGHTLLLTGDLEGAGLERVLTLPPTPVDILMAPHHGSRASNKPELADWARPRVVIACQGPPRGVSQPAEPYSKQGATFFGTWPNGAITIHSGREELVIETFVTGGRIALR
jgi:competence protein ComEC